MAFDGAAFNETIPTNSDLASEIDDYMRDIKIAIRSRMAFEHAWPSSQTATAEAGYHTFITLSGQSSAPVLVQGTNTQLAAIWCSSGSKNVMLKDSAGTNYTLLSSGKGINIVGAFYSATGTVGDSIVGSSGGGIKVIGPGTDGYVWQTHNGTADNSWIDPNTLISTIKDYQNTSNSSTTRGLSSFKFAYGNSLAVGANTTVVITSLPFSSIGSYSLVTCYSGPTAVNENLLVTQISGGTVTIKNDQALSQTVNWLAFGI